MYYIGVDHHKRNSYVTSLDGRGEIVMRKNLSAKAGNLTAFFSAHPRPYVAGIEACYAWEYVADIVEGLGETIQVGHPQLLKAFARRHKKNDKIDSWLAAWLLYRGDFPAIAHPPKAARARRDLYRQRMELVVRRSSAASRAKAQADRLGFQATMNLSTYKGINALGNLPILRREHQEIFASHVLFLTFLTREIKRLDRVIKRVATQNESVVLLETIPGVGWYLGLLIASEVFDINRFPNARKFVAYAGVAPGSFSSGGKVFRGRLCPNVNRYLRWAFGETVIHYTTASPYAKRKYDRLKAAKGWKTARIAIARHVAGAAYHMLKERRPFRPAR